MFKKIAVLMAALLALSFLFGACGGSEFNYNGDMSKYVTLPEDALKAAIKVGKESIVDEAAVNAQVSTNVTNAWKYTSAKPKFKKDEAIKETDLSYIYYYGVLAETDKAFDGGSNMGEKEPTALLIGSGTFIDGFEDALVGVKPTDTSLTSSTGTKVEETSIVYLTATTTYKNDDGKDVTVDDFTFKNETRFDLSKSNNVTDEFRDGAVKNGVGKEFEVKDIEIEKDDKTYKATAKVKVTKVVKDVCINVTFPDDYSKTELQGKEAKFYVVVDGFLDFDTVATVLGKDENGNTTALKADDGKTRYETYYQKTEKNMKETYDKNVLANRYNAIWDYLMVTAKFSVPASVYAQCRDEAEENLRYTYESGSLYGYIPYKSIYESFEAMVKAMYGQDNWETALAEACETSIKERMLLHYLADELSVTVKAADVDAKWKKLKATLDTQNATYDTENYKEAVEEALLWDAVMARLASGDYITVTEKETEKATEKSTEASTEKPTEAPSEAPSEIPSEVPSEASSTEASGADASQGTDASSVAA